MAFPGGQKHAVGLFNAWIFVARPGFLFAPRGKRSFTGLFLVVILAIRVQLGEKTIDPTGCRVIGCPLPK
jgi:hypothetical protein